MSALPTVSWETVMHGLGMPGERRNIGVPPATAEEHLDHGDYFLDERLGELRLVSDPHVSIRLNEFEVEWFKERASKEVRPA